MASWALAYSANSEWMRNQPPRSSRETKRLERSSSASTDRRIGAVEHGVAELGGERAEDRDAAAETIELVLVERGENLAAQVLGHEALVSSERPHGPARIVDGPQPQPGEDERRRPALGALDEQRRSPPRRARDVRARRAARAPPPAVNASSARAQLGERAGGAQAREPERRIDPRDEDQARVRRQGARGRSRSTPGIPGSVTACRSSSTDDQLPCRARRRRSGARRPRPRWGRPPRRAAAAHPARAPAAPDRPPSRRTATAEPDRCHPHRA